jgi:hypothetical protein
VNTWTWILAAATWGGWIGWQVRGLRCEAAEYRAAQERGDAAGAHQLCDLLADLVRMRGQLRRRPGCADAVEALDGLILDLLTVTPAGAGGPGLGVVQQVDAEEARR